MSRLARTPQIAVVEPGPSPERTALAEAAAAYADKQREIAASAEAVSQAEDQVFTLYRAVDAAEADLARAKAEAAMPEVLQTARQALKKAQNDKQEAQERREALQTVHERVRRGEGLLRIGRDDALTAYVRSAPETRAVFDAFVRARAEFDRLESIVNTLALANALPEGCSRYRMGGVGAQPVDGTDAAHWKGSIEALRSGAEGAKLPEVQ